MFKEELDAVRAAEESARQIITAAGAEAEKIRADAENAGKAAVANAKKDAALAQADAQKAAEAEADAYVQKQAATAAAQATVLSTDAGERMDAAVDLITQGVKRNACS